jgi:hypothetical protein
VLFERPTRRLFEEAAITTGMTVLDVGAAQATSPFSPAIWSA